MTENSPLYGGRPNYDGIASDCTVTVDLTAPEVAAIFWAYDRGLDQLDAAAVEQLQLALGKLKQEIWP
tara:strand:- start:178 stop:381 length:204 start_codon:yes stop_codon:yes gene_type:complete